MSYVNLTIAAALLAVGAGAGWHFGGLESEADLAKYKATANAAIAQAARQETAASEHARAVEKASQGRVERLAQTYQEDLAREKESNGRLVSDLRTGNVKLHSRWQACVATDRLSEAARTAGSPDDAARDREGSASRVIGAADRDAAKIRALQEYAREVSGR